MINIQDIIPFMKEGWVAMDSNGEWWWYRTKPHIDEIIWENGNLLESDCLGAFDIAPADDWTQSLIQVDHFFPRGKKGRWKMNKLVRRGLVETRKQDS